MGDVLFNVMRGPCEMLEETRHLKSSCGSDLDQTCEAPFWELGNKGARLHLEDSKERFQIKKVGQLPSAAWRI